ncbi:MAG: hypothetical protein MI919_26515 [Holophagales bacterium]|nr:hypothetical protein [Holophagales bacterium]
MLDTFGFRTLFRSAVLGTAGFCLAVAAGAANYIVASEHLSLSPGTLQDVVDAAGNGGMVIVDGHYRMDQPLVLPRFFRLVGMGPQGQGILEYTQDSGAAIQFSGPESTSSVVIENLNIAGLYPYDRPGSSIGIALDGIHMVFLDNVTVRGFDVGISGSWSFYVHVRDSNVSLNRTYNYHLRDNANSWRISGGNSSQSETAIRVRTSNNTVIEQVSMEGNSVGIHTSTESTHIFNNRFECSVVAAPVLCAGAPAGVVIDTGAALTTLAGNYYSGLTPLVDLSGDGLSYRFDHGSGAVLRAPAGEQPLRVGIGGTTHLLVDSSGRVGVGTESPAEQMHVDGNLRVDGDIVATGSLCIGGGC